MEPPGFLAGTVFSPATLKVLTKAFDDGWAQIESRFNHNPLSIQAARLRLANAILSVAREDSRDPEELKNLALQSMAVRSQVALPGPKEEAFVARVHSPKYWRNHVEETLSIADQIADPECKRLLMGVAETYAQLARRASAAEAAKTTRNEPAPDG